jgi:hypothetical protein
MLSVGRIKREPRPMAVERGGFETLCTQPEARVERQEDFFIWIRCNPLKSPDSAKESKEMQAFLFGFIWFCLDLFGAHSPYGCICGPESLG